MFVNLSCSPLTQCYLCKNVKAPHVNCLCTLYKMPKSWLCTNNTTWLWWTTWHRTRARLFTEAKSSSIKIEAYTKWPTHCIWHSQRQFLNENCWFFIWISLKFVFTHAIDEKLFFGSDNGLVPISQQTFVWTNDGHTHRDFMDMITSLSWTNVLFLCLQSSYIKVVCSYPFIDTCWTHTSQWPYLGTQKKVSIAPAVACCLTAPSHSLNNADLYPLITVNNAVNV